MSIRCAVIGCGNMGSRHAETIRDAAGLSLSAVCDVDTARAAALASRFEVDGLSSAEALVARDDVDAVVVALPSGCHAEYGILAAEAGKHVLVEKPIELSLERADQLIETCRRQGVALSVVSQHRFHPAVRALHEALSEGRLGRLVLCSAQSEWKRDQAYYEKAPGRGLTDPAEGGVLINQAVHYIDLLLWLCGPAAEVEAMKSTLTHEIAVEDVAAVVLRFENGALGTITSTTSVHPQQPEKLEIHGEKGTVVIESGKIASWHVEDMEIPEVMNLDEHDPKPKTAAVRRQLEDFAAAIAAGRSPLVTGEQGRAVLATILEAYRTAGEPRLAFTR